MYGVPDLALGSAITDKEIFRSEVADDAGDITAAALQLAGEVTGAAGNLASDRGDKVAGVAAQIAGSFLNAAGSATGDASDVASTKDSKKDN